MSTPANWYPDPNGHAELRYWDGSAWTDHVSTSGQQNTDRVSAPKASKLDRLEASVTVGKKLRPDKIQQQPTDTGHRGAGLTGKVEGGGGTLLSEPVLVVNQKVKTMFTTADNYVVQIHQRMAEPLHTLTVASALCIDTALKQDDRSLG
jgi:hypothetical protein